MTILFVGPTPWGSDSRALAMAFRGEGAVVLEVDRNEYLPMKWQSVPLRIVRRLIRPLILRDHNRALQAHVGNPAIDFVLVFKGMLVSVNSLRSFKDEGKSVYAFYPDVAFGGHGTGIEACLPMLDCLFTTKSFHLEDSRVRGLVRDMVLLRHGCDPEVHRPLPLGDRQRDAFGCDVSFIGCWSPRKESMLRPLAASMPRLRLHLWGPGWSRAAEPVRSCWKGRGAYGDELAAIYQASSINLGLLSEAPGGGGHGDLVTARTWQIPSTGAFMLHERTDELLTYFREGEELATFDGPEDLVAKVRAYLNDAPARERIRRAGRERCLRDDYTYRPAARAILDYHWARSSRSGAPGP